VIQIGGLSKNIMRTKSGKINRITKLNDEIEKEVKEISCSECLNIIIYHQLE
jgi:hypothetical protein